MRLRLCILMLLAVSVAVFAQSRRMRGGNYNKEYMGDRGPVPMWDVDPELPRDSFTFARVKYRSWTQRRSWKWDTDFRDSDLNLSFRLQQLTAMRVDPEGTVVEITDPDLFHYPFLFMSGVGGWEVNEEEAEILRRHLLGGGFLFVDDFHGKAQWNNFHKCIRKVFPDREPIEIPLEHPIFHMIYDLKERPQVPNISIGQRAIAGGPTWEEPDWKEVHYCAIYDDKGRMMVFIAHNTDLGDGWEEEATDPLYFLTFSEPKAFPVGFNVLIYAMTH
jgi:hypothetical protein